MYILNNKNNKKYLKIKVFCPKFKESLQIVISRLKLCSTSMNNSSLTNLLNNTFSL